MRSSLVPVVVLASCVSALAATGPKDQAPAVAAISLAPSTGSADAVSPGPKRAGGGPEKPEIKFQLPPAPVLSPAEQIRTFKLPPGFRAELVASEPMIQSPVALSFDDQGRIYVVEMRGYMPDMEAVGEDRPVGRVSRLEDSDGDGVMDKSTVFVDGLVMPRAVMALGDGALVGAPPTLTWYHDTDGDGVADKSEVVASDFGKVGGQPEHMINSPTWMLDNWITFANSNVRYRLQGGKWLTGVTASAGQWGLTQDDWGRPFFNYNSALLHSHVVPANFYARNPNLAAKTGLNLKVMSEGTTWPSHPTPGVNRGYNGTTLREDGTLASVTATCGPSIYRGHLFPEEFRGNAFVPEPAGNLIKRLQLSEKEGLVRAQNAYDQKEFLTSSDERFRPVNTYTGPDGALYVVDMGRGVIQHKAFLTYYLAANIEARRLEQPISLGRIYRIVPERIQPRPVRLPAQSGALVAMLEHPNGWVRDTAQRLLVERGDVAVVPALSVLAAKGTTPQARVQALWSLEGLGALTPELLGASLKDPHPKVRQQAVRLADRTMTGDLLKLVHDPSPEVRTELAFHLGSQPGDAAQEGLITLLGQGGGPLLAEAVASGLRGRELEFLEVLLKQPVRSKDALISSDILPVLAGCVIAERRSGRIARFLDLVAALPAESPRQLALLKGCVGKPLAKGTSPKLIYLDAAPEALSALEAIPGEKTRQFLVALDRQLAWPQKPGVPPRPALTALNEQQQILFEKGRGIYQTLCTGCHQPGGIGLEGLAPPLLDSEWVLGPVDRPVRILLHGLSGPVRVGGVLWKLEMPALGQLSDEDIAGVLTYLRREWEHRASPVSPKDVERIRSGWVSRNKPWTEAELLKPQAVSVSADARN
jgi:putative membrane-bound dehydrogenase-like protein